MRKLVWVVQVIALAAVYVGLSPFGLPLRPLETSGAAPLWPGAGLAVALFWLYGWRYVAVVVLGQLAIGILLGRGVVSGLSNAGIGVVEAAAAAWMLTRLRVNPEFRNLTDVIQFIAFGALTPALLAGLLGTIGLVATGVISTQDYWSNVWVWGLGDALGIAIFAPLVIQWRHGWPFGRSRDGWAWGGVVALTLVLGGAITWFDRANELFFLLIPLVVLGAASNGMAGASAVVVALTLSLLGFNLSDHDDFSSAVRLLFLGAATVTGYLLAVALGQRTRAEAELRYQATHDSLTGLANRGAFDAALREVAASPGSHALLYLDLDYFKVLNDSRGHALGDRFLAGLASRLATAATASALVARLGGDEFGVLLASADDQGAYEQAHRMRQTVLDYQHAEDGLTFRVGVSIGVAQFEGGEAPAAALSRADIACYVAKSIGPNHIHGYRRDDPALRADHIEIQRIAQLHAALADGRFRLARQRILPLRPGVVESPIYEMLLRLDDGKGSLLGPGAFLDVAMRYGLMPLVDRWVIEQSFRYRDSVSTPMRLSINLSGHTLNDAALFDDVMVLVKKYSIDPGDIFFEVTEQVAIQRLTRAIAMMDRFVAAGFSFALDDFGNGVASFGYLQELPVAVVKIDGQFVRDLDSDPANAIIVESLVKLAAVKRIRCVAEWIETRESLDRLIALGVDYGQGYFLHKPEPVPMTSPLPLPITGA